MRRKNPAVGGRARKLLEQLEREGMIDQAELVLESLLGDVERAAKGYKKFHWGRDAAKLVETEAPTVRAGDVLEELGTLHEVAYQTIKGKDDDAIWVHAFKRPLPRLAVNQAGKLIVVGGGYLVNERGIVG